MRKKYNETQARMLLYQTLSEKGRFHGIPKMAPSTWRQVLEVTSGLGIRPFKDPFNGWLELKEFKSHVPTLLRNYGYGYAPDLVAQLCGFETHQELYDALDLPMVAEKSEADYYQDLADTHEEGESL